MLFLIFAIVIGVVLAVIVYRSLPVLFVGLVFALALWGVSALTKVKPDPERTTKAVAAWDEEAKVIREKLAKSDR